MTFFFFKTLAVFTVAVSSLVTPASAHVSLQQPTAATASSYHAVLAQVQRPAAVKVPAAGKTSAAVKVEQAWVRPSVPGQQGTGGYMKLTAREGLRLVGAESSVAGVAQFHQMKMEGNVMTMRAAGAIDLPAGKTVELKPGGLHLMLMDLKQPLATGTSVPLTLVLQDGRGTESRVETLLLVSAAPPAAGQATETHKH